MNDIESCISVVQDHCIEVVKDLERNFDSESSVVAAAILLLCTELMRSMSGLETSVDVLIDELQKRNSTGESGSTRHPQDWDTG